MQDGCHCQCANPSLLGGGGVDGAIHRAAGPELLEECRLCTGADLAKPKLQPKRDNPPCRLPDVIHTPGPVYQGGRAGESEVLAACYRNSLKLAAEHGLRTVAFPSISTGIYGYPVSLAARTAVREILTFLRTQSTVREVTMVCFDAGTKKGLRGGVPGKFSRLNLRSGEPWRRIWRIFRHCWRRQRP